MKRYFNYGLAALAVALVLVIAYFSSGDRPEPVNEPVSKTVTSNIEQGVAKLPGLAVEDDRPTSPGDVGQIEQAAPATTEAGLITTPETESDPEGETDSAPFSASNTTTPIKAAEPPASHSNELDKQADSADSNSPPTIPDDSSHTAGDVADDRKKTDQYLTEPVPEGKPEPTEPQNADVDTKQAFTVTLSVTCGTILDNLDQFNADKLEVLPGDGVIFPAQKVTFYEGESVFDVLLREMKKHKIHMEFEVTPLYNSNYIEGINNIYEFDCGELSGWMYRVNGWFPNYGASRYSLQDGDLIEWLYTCDLGRDIGGGPSGLEEEA